MTDEDLDCEACGSTPADRRQNKPDEPQAVTRCPYCRTLKCCMCDMGDDVECPACND